jgi:hypothetical protein
VISPNAGSLIGLYHPHFFIVCMQTLGAQVGLSRIDRRRRMPQEVRQVFDGSGVLNAIIIVANYVQGTGTIGLFDVKTGCWSALAAVACGMARLLTNCSYFVAVQRGLRR